MGTAKVVLGVCVGVIAGLGVGWLLGSAGRGDSTRAVQAVERRSDLLQARGSSLAARVDLYNVNFGEASRHLEDAKGALRRAAAPLKDGTSATGGDAKSMDVALAQLNEAQTMAGRLDQGANARAAAAVQTIDGLLNPAVTP